MRTVPTPIKRSRYLVFDVETTGLLPKQSQNQRISISDYPYIIQLSFVIYDLEQRKIIKTYDSYIKIPETVIISQYVSNLTGITNEICKSKGVPITDAIKNFHEAYIICEGLVAHNMDFDQTMIEVEMERNKARILEKMPECYMLFNKTYETINNVDRFCTMKKGVNICNLLNSPIMDGDRVIKKASLKWPKLVELFQALFGEKPENLHNSMVDVLACLKCYLKMRHSIEM